MLWKIIYTNWQKIMVNHFLDFIYKYSYIYIDWQKDKANRLKFIQTIIDNYRCKTEWELAYKYNYRDEYRTQLYQK